MREVGSVILGTLLVAASMFVVGAALAFAAVGFEWMWRVLH